MDTKAMRCPCGTELTAKPMGPRRDPPCVGCNKSYADCCGHYLDNGEIVPTAEALMRSRYTAYTLGREDYLLATWHRSTRPASLAPASQPLSKWLGLEVRRHEHSQ